MRWGNVVVVWGLVVAPAAAILIVHAATSQVALVAGDTFETAPATPNPGPAAPASVAHVPLPSEVRGIYWTATTASGARGTELTSFMTSTGLNAAVIDLQTGGGYLAITPNDPSLSSVSETKPLIKNLDSLLKTLAEKEIYRIARVVVVKNGALVAAHPEAALRNASGSLWHDSGGATWMDPTSTVVSDFAIAAAKEAYARGFDEIQFDYIRFPSDGSVKSIVYPSYDGKETKAEALKGFFDRVGAALREEGIPISFDLFGQTFWSDSDMGIGQRMVNAVPDATFLSPMTYPSHYVKGFDGCANPAACPYRIIYDSLVHGEAIVAKVLQSDPAAFQKQIRPWIQDFNLGATYDASMVDEEIRAVRDAGGSGFLIWNAANKYHTAHFLPSTSP